MLYISNYMKVVIFLGISLILIKTCSKTISFHFHFKLSFSKNLIWWKKCNAKNCNQKRFPWNKNTKRPEVFENLTQKFSETRKTQLTGPSTVIPGNNFFPCTVDCFDSHLPFLFYALFRAGMIRWMSVT